MNMLKEGKVDVVISAGNSGAVATSAVMTLGRIKGVSRPVIAMAMPTRHPGRPFLLIDAGANTDCEPEWLAQFAIMGSVYSQFVLRRPNPVVGLLSIGTEDCKGNELTKKAFPLIKALPGANFRGNCEGHDLFEGDLDVIVSDGFVGNIVLKTIESAARAIGSWMKEEFVRHPLRQLGALLLRGALMAMKRKMDPEVYGGAPLLGVPGTVIITHGASSSRAIFHAVIAGINAARNNVTKEIEERINNPDAPAPAPSAEPAPLLEQIEPTETLG
jgi:glycerol-3-phosphate acyltransferase PlsX